MIDHPNHVHFVNPRMLLIEIEKPQPLRFTHIVLITRVVRRHGGHVQILSQGRHYDASSAFEVIESLGVLPSNHFAFVGPEAPLRDLSLLCSHVLSDGGIGSLPEELGYLR